MVSSNKPFLERLTPCEELGSPQAIFSSDFLSRPGQAHTLISTTRLPRVCPSFSSVKITSTGRLLGPEAQLEKHMKANISVTYSVPTATQSKRFKTTVSDDMEVTSCNIKSEVHVKNKSLRTCGFSTGQSSSFLKDKTISMSNLHISTIPCGPL